MRRGNDNKCRMRGGLRISNRRGRDDAQESTSRPSITEENISKGAGEEKRVLWDSSRRERALTVDEIVLNSEISSF